MEYNRQLVINICPIKLTTFNHKIFTENIILSANGYKITIIVHNEILDGTFIFVYQHFTDEAKDIFETDKYPIMIGLKDGFSIPVEKDEKGSFSIYLKKIQSKKPSIDDVNHLGRGGIFQKVDNGP